MTLANAAANVAVNDTLYTLNKGRFEVGKIGENDLLKSELALLRARAAVDDAKLARDRAEAALRRHDRLSGRAAVRDRDAGLDPDRRRRSRRRRSRGAEELERDRSRTSWTTCRRDADISQAQVEQPVQRHDRRAALGSTRRRPCSTTRIRVRSASRR